MDKKIFDSMVLTEIGLDVDDYGNIVDQDNNNIIAFKGKTLTNNYPPSKGQIVFNPLEDQKQMNSLFMYFTNKIHEEEGSYVSSIFTNGTPNKNIKSNLGITVDDHQMQSKAYYNDSVKYLDLIIQLNGNTVDLSAFDFKPDGK